jgi:twinkle protein
MEITEIKSTLRGQVEAICRMLLPGGKVAGNEYEVGSTDGAAGKSCKIKLTGDKAGVWSDFATGDSGDLIDLWSHATGKDLKETLDDIRDYLGIKEPTYTRPKKETYQKPEKPTCSAPKGQVLEYLRSRSVSEAAIKAYKVGENGSQMFFPFIWGGELTLVKVREAIDGVSPKPTSAQCRPVLFGWQAIDPNARAIVICEGEIDALSLYDYGFPAVSVPFGGGSGNKQQWVEHEFHNLDRFEEIYLCLDNDETGLAGAKEIADRLGRHRCKLVTLPCKDANQCAKEGISTEEIESAFAHASLEDPDELVAAGAFYDAVNETFRPTDKTQIGYTVPWGDLRDKIYFRPHELTLWTGASGAGKSQALSHALVDMIANGAKVCLASLEMTPAQSLKRMVKQLGDVDVPTENFLKECIDFLDGKLWLYNFVGRASADTLLEGFEYARKRYGVDTFVIDSFMRLGVGVDDYKAQDNAIFKLTDWVVNRPVHLHLVAHARKAGDEKGVPDTESVKGTSEIGSNAFNIVGVYRNRNLEDSLARAEVEGDLEKLNTLRNTPGVTINVAKQRNGDFEGKKGLFFDHRTYRYYSGQRDGVKYIQP